LLTRRRPVAAVNPSRSLLPAVEALRAPALAVVQLLLGTVLPSQVRAQGLTTQVPSELNAIGARVDALTILGGDFGFSDGTFHSLVPDGSGPRSTLTMGVTKIGGDGDIGDPVQLGNFDIGWQPRVQGSAGYLESTEHLATPLLAGDTSKMHAASVEFGGGARFWFNDKLSLAPTVMLLYGHTTESYTATSNYAQTHLTALQDLGLINWSIETLSLRPALNVQYIQPVGRSLVTLSADGAAFLTRSLSGDATNINVAGNSGFLTYKLDLDIPTGTEVAGHELRTGGYVSRTQLYGELSDGLGVHHLDEVHGRLVMDFLGQFGKVQWIGLGASYVWGPSFHGWTIGADVAFRF
jgi:hypothetical protein